MESFLIVMGITFSTLLAVTALFFFVAGVVLVSMGCLTGCPA